MKNFKRICNNRGLRYYAGKVGWKDNGRALRRFSYKQISRTVNVEKKGERERERERAGGRERERER